MLLNHLWKNEPLGVLALLVTIATSMAPLTYEFIRSSFFYASNFDIRCDPFAPRMAHIDDWLLFQRTKCTITNNLSHPISIVGIKPALFHDDYAYPELFLLERLKPEIGPLYLSPGEFYRFESIYYILIPSEMAPGGNAKCMPRDALKETLQRPEDLISVRPCYDGKPGSKPMLQAFYEGVDVELYRFNKTGTVIQLGNGRELHYYPEIETYGFSYPPASPIESLKVEMPSKVWTNTPPPIQVARNTGLLLVIFSIVSAGLYVFYSSIRVLWKRVQQSRPLTLEPVHNSESEASATSKSDKPQIENDQPR